MIWARSLAKAAFLVDNSVTCDHLVDASTKTMKYLNGPHGGWIGPHISPCIRCRKRLESFSVFAYDGLIFNFPNEQAWHNVLLYTRSLLVRGCPWDEFRIRRIIL
ncbi:hypothetical protein RchiOBHm_Chr3g0465021 [Rosa chinensis]|uniref:Uncharacterized protein n=1 Tax=Rosa chinensis TaxID=74649 RepID=A0A2P6R9L3_ROSCH|nr:hypothetical protein RchiOBHm_Chr3g0465021 [Rosa chinensis]